MKRFIKKFLAFSVLLAFASCETQMIDKIDVFKLETGAYMRTVAPWPLTAANGITYKIATLPAAQVAMTIEAVDPQQGAMLASYDLQVRFVDNTPANGNSAKAYVDLRSIPAASFTKDASVSMYPRTQLVLTAAELMTKLGLKATDVAANDSFEVHAIMRLTDGRSFTDANSGSEIKGGAYFKSPFFYRITLAN
ncbi:hypothetical protein [Tellurirhabdus bombi]|uniref:hypothetical protein n=1 Tax=Tellurirhabdus bombi TaxID=2907205 RepID=UPI001F1633E7|nr:hypothetical protein [Tellurirhabdus bombi]